MAEQQRHLTAIVGYDGRRLILRTAHKVPGKSGETGSDD